MYMPMTIDMSNKKFLIFGGGQVALRRLKTLLAYEVDVLIVAPELNADFKPILNAFQWLKSSYDKSYINNVHYVIAATNDEAINEIIKEDCHAVFVPCLNVSNGKQSDFHIPAIVKRGPVHISISTQGESPGVSKLLKSDLDKFLTQAWLEKAAHIVAIRKIIKKCIKSNIVREKILVELTHMSLLELKQRRTLYENQNWIQGE